MPFLELPMNCPSVFDPLSDQLVGRKAGELAEPSEIVHVASSCVWTDAQQPIRNCLRLRLFTHRRETVSAIPTNPTQRQCVTSNEPKGLVSIYQILAQSKHAFFPCNFSSTASRHFKGIETESLSSKD